MQNGMAQDFSWRRQVQRYVEIYEQLVTWRVQRRPDEGACVTQRVYSRTLCPSDR